MTTLVAFISTTLISTFIVAKSYFLVVICFMIFEKLFPAEKKQPLKNLFFNIKYTLLVFLLTPFVLIWPTVLATHVFTATRGSLISVNLNQLATSWPLRYLILPFLPTLIFDFFYYWHHRLQHQLPIFWLQHKLHHTEDSLCCMTNFRHHWLEDGIRVFTITIPMAYMISLTPVQGAWVVILIGQWSLFIHSNIRIPLGPFTPVFAGPQLHRIHHSRESKHINKNFAAFFPIWDIVFGTYYRPCPGEWPSTGLSNTEQVTTLWQASIIPIRDGYRQLFQSKLLQRVLKVPI